MTSLFRFYVNYTSAPDRESFRPTDAAELTALIAECEDSYDTATTEFSRTALDSDLSVLRAALIDAQAGASVLLARDEDGWYAAAEGENLLELPYDTLSVSERIDAVVAAREVGAADARADREAGTWPATDRRLAVLRESVPGDDGDPRVAGYRAAYEREV